MVVSANPVQDGHSGLIAPVDITPGPGSKTAAIADSLRDVAQNLTSISEFWRTRLETREPMIVVVEWEPLDRSATDLLRRATSEAGTAFEVVIDFDED